MLVWFQTATIVSMIYKSKPISEIFAQLEEDLSILSSKAKLLLLHFGVTCICEVSFLRYSHCYKNQIYRARFNAKDDIFNIADFCDTRHCRQTLSQNKDSTFFTLRLNWRRVHVTLYYFSIILISFILILYISILNNK